MYLSSLEYTLEGMWPPRIKAVIIKDSSLLLLKLLSLNYGVIPPPLLGQYPIGDISENVDMENDVAGADATVSRQAECLEMEVSQVHFNKENAIGEDASCWFPYLIDLEPLACKWFVALDKSIATIMKH
ncbi:hypothetical protein Tco_0444622 [Tanacetum coccineum]